MKRKKFLFKKKKDKRNRCVGGNSGVETTRAGTASFCVRHFALISGRVTVSNLLVPGSPDVSLVIHLFVTVTNKMALGVPLNED